MSDNNRSGFWSSAWGTFALLAALFIILPTDKILNTVGKGGRAAYLRALNAWSLLKKCSKWLLALTVIMTVVSWGIILHGVGRHDHVTTAVGAGLWVSYLFIAWLLVSAIVGGLTVLGEVGVNFAGSALGAIFSKMGLAKKDGDMVKLDLSGLRGLMKSALVIPAALSVAAVFLALMPAKVMLGVVVLLGVIGLAKGLVAMHTGDDLKDGWRKVNKALSWAMVLIAALGFLWFFLPLTFGKYADPGSLDRWIADPTWGLGWIGTLIVIALAGFVVWLIAMKKTTGEVQKKLGEGIPAAVGVIMLLVFLFMGPFAGKVKGFLGKYTDEGSAQAETSAPTGTGARHQSSEQVPGTGIGPAAFPSFEGGGSASLDAPDVPYVPKVRTPRTEGKPNAAEASPAIESAPAPVAAPPPVRRTPKKGDGYDEATALLDAAGL